MTKNQLKKLILETVVETHQYHIDEALLLENRISDFKSKYDSKLAPATIDIKKFYFVLFCLFFFVLFYFILYPLLP